MLQVACPTQQERCSTIDSITRVVLRIRSALAVCPTRTLRFSPVLMRLSDADGRGSEALGSRNDERRASVSRPGRIRSSPLCVVASVELWRLLVVFCFAARGLVFLRGYESTWRWLPESTLAAHKSCLPIGRGLGQNVSISNASKPSMFECRTLSPAEAGHIRIAPMIVLKIRIRQSRPDDQTVVRFFDRAERSKSGSSISPEKIAGADRVGLRHESGVGQ